jgi:transglutaminase-like putative cysteine protease
MSDSVDAVYKVPNPFMDWDSPNVVAFAQEAGGDGTDREVAVRLYYSVRDSLRYNPWSVALTPEGYRASEVVERSYERGGHCIDKALLLAAAARARGIPSRLHFANVRNHVGTATLESKLGSDLLVFHGYTELWIDGRWVAATTAFNVQLCERLGVEALEFDGVNDSVFQAYDRQAGRFMEYVDDHGTFAVVPVERMVAAWREHYPPVREGLWPSMDVAD